MKKIFRILLDLDGVLADFDKGACYAHGISPQKMIELRTPGDWYLPTVFAKCKQQSVMSVEEFWQPITRGGAEFWVNLKEFSWHRELVLFISSLKNTEDFHIITAPSQCPTSYTGKVRWIKKQYGAGFDRFAITPHKEIFAQPGVLLIDDREENINKFVAAGGEGLIFPSQGNSLHLFADDPMTYVRKMLAEKVG